MNEKSKQLAINGGEKAIQTPLKNRYNIDDKEKKAICDLFDHSIKEGVASGYSGEIEEQFCKEFAEYMGEGYADGVNSGTTAVFVALRAMEIEPFSEVIVSAVTDPGGIMPIVMNNCIPVVADTEPNSYNIGPKQIQEKITPHTKAIIISHILGEPAKMDEIMEIAKKHGLKVVEDCSQSHGATLNGQKVGTFGDAAAFSTMFGKHFNTGGQGGVVYTKDQDTYWKIRRHADRGKPFGLPEGSTNVVASLNFNLSEIGAVIGRVQIKKLAGLIEKRRELVAYLKEQIKDLKSISIPEPPKGAQSSYWFLRMNIHTDQIRVSKDGFLDAVMAEGVLMMKDYSFALPHTFDWFKNKRAFGKDGFPWTAPQYKGDMTTDFSCPNVEQTMKDSFNMFVYESWTKTEVDAIVNAFQKVEDVYQK